jgi:hypothetical protein
MVDASEFEIAGQKTELRVYAYCVAPESYCYDSRCKAYRKMKERHEKLRIVAKENRRKRILDQVSASNYRPRNPLRAYITKRECVYLILQFICYAGGRSRLENFARKHSLEKNMPSKFGAQVTYVRNKLLDYMNEAQLLDILFGEAASSAAYAPQAIEPIQFDRKNQKEISIVAGIK